MKASTMPTMTEIRERAVPILERYGVRRAAIFGSVATGKVNRRSDIDLVLELERPIGLFDFVGLKLELQEALGHRVDLVEYAAIKPLLRERILAQQVPIL